MIVRSYRPRDAVAIQRICLATGDGGGPAHRILRDPTLMAHVFVGPYLLLHPELVLVVEDEGTVLGYLVAALVTTEFFARWQLEWSPRFAASHPGSPSPNATDADSQLSAFLHQPRLMLTPDQHRFPAHLHMNLLAHARGRGGGRRLLRAAFRQLAQCGSPGVQLSVQAVNARAQAFYRRLGMIALPSAGVDGVRFGRPLDR